MLTRLTISNLATIQSLSVEFGPGFTVLTGETGAGKSILIGALRLVLGGKSSPDQVRGGEKQTVVEACFDLTRQPHVRRQLQELEIPGDTELVLRRILHENGRSRALVNDCAITQARLELLGTYLVNIHGQHDNQMLLDSRTHLEFLDAFAGLTELKQQVTLCHGRYTALAREREGVLRQAENRRSRAAELAETARQIRAAAVSADEEAALKQALQRLTHADQLARIAQAACETLYEGESPVLARLGELAQELGQAAHLDPSLAPLVEQLAPVRYQLDDLYRSLHGYMARLEADPAQLDRVNARLAEYEKLKRKFGGSIESVLAALVQAEAELETLEKHQEQQEAIERELAQVAERLHASSMDLSMRRKESARKLDRRLIEQLGELGMDKAQFETLIAPQLSPAGKSPYYTPTGTDAVEFLLSTNPGQALRPLARIASGGELSRTMLALKTVLENADPTGTLIFDEVDAGISGAMAEVVGHKLRALGQTHQVLCITHLPQIAALGTRHYLVSKETDAKQTYTRIAQLEAEDKVREVARLLSGLNVTSRSLASAQEMVDLGRRDTL